MTVVLDSSALLALLWTETGSEAVVAVLEDACISAVNMAEVCSKLVDRGIEEDDIRSLLSDLPLKVVSFDEKQAFKVGQLRHTTRHLGLSIGDRSCLGLGIAINAVVMTADRAWSGLQLRIDIKSIR